MFSVILGVSTVRWWNDMWWSIPFFTVRFFQGRMVFPRRLAVCMRDKLDRLHLRNFESWCCPWGFLRFFTKHVKTHDLLVPWLLDVSYDAWVMACQTPTKIPWNGKHLSYSNFQSIQRIQMENHLYHRLSPEQSNNQKIIVLVLNNHSIIQLVVHSEIPLAKAD